MFKSAKTAPSANGMAHQDNKPNKKVRIGAKIKILAFALEGKIVSLTKSFKPSANGWSNPKRPTTLGPLRRWIAPITLRSANVKYATAINKGRIRKIILESM